MCSGCEADVTDTVCRLCTGNDDALAMCSDVDAAPVCEMGPGDAVGGVEEQLSTDTHSGAACALLVTQHRANANAMTWNIETLSCT